MCGGGGGHLLYSTFWIGDGVIIVGVLSRGHEWIEKFDWDVLKWWNWVNGERATK